MTIYEFFTLMGGVGLFLYGMSIMSTGLKGAAGDKMQVILEHATANRYLAVIVGIVVTLLIQSSSATDMMVISFVNSGLMTLAQSIGVIMGANIGTTVTAQITAFNLGAYAPMILFIGAMMYLFLKKNTVKYIGCIIMGFGMLFFGIALIKEAIVPLSKSPEFISFLTTLEHPAIAVIFGVLFTAVLQSSSSSVVIFQTFAAQGLLTFDITVYLVIGAAIGSVAPNLLASLTTNRNGKRTAILNLLFNLIRAAIIILLINLFPAFLELIRNLTPNSVGRQVANAHTIFAILAVVIEFPFAGAIVSLAQRIIPMKEEESRQLENRQLRYLNHLPSVLPSSVALQQSRREISRMGHIALNSIYEAIECFFEPDEKKITDVIETEDSVDVLTDAISQKLIALRSRDYGPRDVYQLSQMMMIVSDIERISDHAENIVEYAMQLREKKAVISETGRKELRRLADAATKSLEMSLDIFENEKYDLLPQMEQLEQNVDDLQVEVINNHVQRLMQVACDPMGGVIFTDMATNLERCSDHALNVATALAKIPADL